MDKSGIGFANNFSCLLGLTVGENVALNRKNSLKDISNEFILGDHSRLSVFTAEGLLRATHRAKMHGTNGTFAEIVYESYQRLYNVILNSKEKRIPQNDGWLIKEKVFYHNSSILRHVSEVIRQEKMGDLESPINSYSDAEVLPSMVSIGLFFKEDEKLAFKVAQEVCALTHGDLVTCRCCGVLSSLIVFLQRGCTLKNAILMSVNLLNDDPYSVLVKKDLLQVISFFDNNKSSLQSKEYLVRTFANVLPSQNSSLYIFSVSLLISLYYVLDFEEGIMVSSEMLHNDNFASSAIVGALLGLINGSEAFPQKWALSDEAFSILREISEDVDIAILGEEVYSTNRTWAYKYPGY